MRPQKLPIVVITSLCATVTHAAAGELSRCASDETSVVYNATDFVELSGDTGWFPGSSPAQLRLTAKVAGHTMAAAGVRAEGCWPTSMQATLSGVKGSGLLDVAYGAQLQLFGRIHTSVLGISINWEGQIPIPYIPEDLLIGDTTAFDPGLDSTTYARVSDSTDPVTVLSTDVLSSVINLSGISGGLRVSVTGSMATIYRTKQATFATATVDAPTDQVNISAPSGGFGAVLELPVSLAGTVRYEPKLTFIASLDLKFFGIRVIDWQLFGIPMSLPAMERAVTLKGDSFRIGLPEIEGIADGARMDFANSATQTLPIKNKGGGPLQISPIEPPPGVTMAAITVAPNGEASLTVMMAEGALPSSAAQLVLETNDPDHPRLLIDLGRDVGGTDGGEAGDQSGGCSTGKGLDLGALALLALVFVRRRNRGA